MQTTVYSVSMHMHWLTNAEVVQGRYIPSICLQEADAIVALDGPDLQPLLEAASAVRDAGHQVITFSPKVSRCAEWHCLCPCFFTDRHYKEVQEYVLTGQSNNVNCDYQVFLPITKLCRDTCGYCTFAQPPVPGRRSYMTLPEMLDIAARGAEVGCTEALFTLGVPKASCFLLRRNQVMCCLAGESLPS